MDSLGAPRSCCSCSPSRRRRRDRRVRGSSGFRERASSSGLTGPYTSPPCGSIQLDFVVAATLDDVVSSELMVHPLARDDGTLSWVYRLPEHPGTENFVYDAAVDKRGDVVLSGFTMAWRRYRSSGPVRGDQAGLRKGSVRWRSIWDSAAGRHSPSMRGDVFLRDGRQLSARGRRHLRRAYAPA